MKNCITNKGMVVPLRFGNFHVGDIIRGKVYVNNGRSQDWIEGEIVYETDYARFVLKGQDGQLSYGLFFSKPPTLIKKWNEK